MDQIVPASQFLKAEHRLLVKSNMTASEAEKLSDEEVYAQMS